MKTTVLDCNYRQGADSAITDAAIKIREIGLSAKTSCDLRFGEQLLFTDCKRDDLRQEADAVIEAVVRQYLDGVAQFGVKGTIVLTPRISTVERPPAIFARMAEQHHPR